MPVENNLKGICFELDAQDFRLQLTTLWKQKINNGLFYAQTSVLNLTEPKYQKQKKAPVFESWNKKKDFILLLFWAGIIVLTVCIVTMIGKVGHIVFELASAT